MTKEKNFIKQPRFEGNELGRAREGRMMHGELTEFRGLDKYLKNFLLTEQDLAGKKILDLGSGASRFGDDTREKKLDVKIYSIDPLHTERELKAEGNLIQGIAQALPFKDASFDLILSSYAVPFWILGGREALPQKKWQEFVVEEMARIFHEAAQLLKKGGQARFYPASIRVGVESLMSHEFKPLFDEVVQRIENSARGDYSLVLEEDMIILDKGKRTLFVRSRS